MKIVKYGPSTKDQSRKLRLILSKWEDSFFYEREAENKNERKHLAKMFSRSKSLFHFFINGHTQKLSQCIIVRILRERQILIIVYFQVIQQ